MRHALRGVWRAACVGLLALFAAGAHAEPHGLEFQPNFEVVATDTSYVVNATATMAQNPHLAELVEAGVSVPFVVEFTITRPRWYWTNEQIVQRVMDIRLSFHALTRQYRVSVGNLHRSFGSYEEALSAAFSVRNWVVLDRNRLRGGESYNAALRLRLDVAQLPKPFQVASIGNKDLDLSTGWVEWTFLATPR